MPLIAASVRTLVVSWKEAAERKESVASDAFVIPRRTLVPFAGSLPSASSASFVFSNVSQSTRLPGRKSVSPISSIYNLWYFCVGFYNPWQYISNTNNESPEGSQNTGMVRNK